MDYMLADVTLLNFRRGLIPERLKLSMIHSIHIDIYIVYNIDIIYMYMTIY